MKILFFILLTISIITACRKNRDDAEGPRITSFTVSQTFFSSTDTIAFSVAAEDENPITTLSFYIADADYRAVTSPLTVTVNKTSIAISDVYAFSERYLTGGNYYFVCTATGKNGVTRSNKTITISSLPLQTEGFIVLASDASQYKIGLLSPGFDSLIFQQTFSVRPLRMVFNSYSRQAVVLFENGTASAYDYPGFSEAWTIGGLNYPGYSYKGALQLTGFFTAIGKANGTMILCDESGTVRKTIRTSEQSQTQCTRFVINGDHVITVNEGYGAGQTTLGVSSYVGGGVINEYPLAYTPEAITPWNDTFILVWSQQQVSTFNFGNPVLSQLDALPLSNPRMAVQISENEQLVCFDQSMYLYNPTLRFFTATSMPGGTFFCYDKVSETTLIINGNTITTWVNGIQVMDKNFGFTPISIATVYNK